MKRRKSILFYLFCCPLHPMSDIYQYCDNGLESSNTVITWYGAARRARLRVRRVAPYLVYTMLNGTNNHVCK